MIDLAEKTKNERNKIDNKAFFITTAIDYPNAKPHLGHAYEKILADVIARFKRLQGFDVYFSTGTDEHGLKIQRKAEQEGKSPQQFVDEMAEHFKSLCEVLHISQDGFIRTTEQRHIKVAQNVFKQLFDKGEIYKGRYKELYCVDCETFYTKSELEDGKCPVHKKKPEEVDEENYFFKMGKYRDALVGHIKKYKDFILPEFKAAEILNRLEDELKDLSVSRMSFDWGVPVPVDSAHVQYVWMDALLNYITTIGYPDSEKFKKFWPADVHLIGKDILWHHSVIWGSILSALGIPLPKTVLVHGFITVEGEKISKSLGNVIDPLYLAEKYSADALRYFLIREIPFGEDGDFSERALQSRLNDELVANIGNFIYRVLSFLRANFGSVVPETDGLKKEDKDLFEKITKTKEDMRAAVESYKMRKAIETVNELSAAGNRYFQNKKPWETKKTDPEDCAATLYVSINLVRALVVLLSPFIPFTCERLWEQLDLGDGVDMHKQNLDYVDKLKIKAGHKIGDIEPLFKKFKE